MGPIFVVEIDSLRCSQKKTEEFTVVCDGRRLGKIVFGKQCCTLDPQFELLEKPVDFDVDLVQDGPSGDFRLIFERKASSTSAPPMSWFKQLVRKFFSDPR